MLTAEGIPAAAGTEPEAAAAAAAEGALLLLLPVLRVAPRISITRGF
jgi:hypothetical protein